MQYSHERGERSFCQRCSHVKTEGAILNDYCFLYSEPLALRVAVPSGGKKLIRTAKCCQEFIDPPFYNDKPKTKGSEAEPSAVTHKLLQVTNEKSKRGEAEWRQSRDSSNNKGS